MLTCRLPKLMTRCVPRRRPMKAIPDHTILFDYLDTYQTYICRNKGIECFDHMIIPPPEEQLRILQNLFKIRSEVDTMGLDGVFMKLIMINDFEAINNLMISLDAYQKSLDIIQSIIKFSYDIPITSSHQELI